MNELKLLEDFRAAVAPPGEELLARTRARVLDGGRRARGRRLPGSRNLALTGLAAAATAAAITVALATQSGGPERSAAASPAVKELAYRAAAVAAARPDVPPGQWVYWQEKMVTTAARAAGPAEHDTFQVWTTADSSKAAFLPKGKKVVLMPFLPCAYGAACQSIGQPVPVTLPDGQGEGVTAVAGKVPVSYAGLRSLPRSPAALDRYLAGLPLRGWGPAPVREFEIIKELLTTYVMPPALTAELYRALGSIPGVTVDHDAVDVAGRRGVGFQITLPRLAGGEIDQLILDPTTYSLMGQQLILARSGRVLSGTAILRTAPVSGPGVLP